MQWSGGSGSGLSIQSLTSLIILPYAVECDIRLIRDKCVGGHSPRQLELGLGLRLGLRLRLACDNCVGGRSPC